VFLPAEREPRRLLQSGVIVQDPGSASALQRIMRICLARRQAYVEAVGVG
jgi:hypothetical protein